MRQTEYGYLWVLGVVCPATGHAEGLLSPRLNTGVVNLFLEQFSRTLAADEQAVLIWAGAGFHTSGALQTPSNVTVLQLPAYSPELNPVENLWHDLKSPSGQTAATMTMRRWKRPRSPPGEPPSSTPP